MFNKIGTLYFDKSSSVREIESVMNMEEIEANEFATDCVWPSDVFSDVHKRYDLIISNPPFHAGLKADYSVTRRLICEANQHLTRSGRLVMVTSAFLNYFPHFRRSFSKVHVIAQNRRYRVIEATERLPRS